MSFQKDQLTELYKLFTTSILTSRNLVSHSIQLGLGINWDQSSFKLRAVVVRLSMAANAVLLSSKPRA